jgi:hypothetical protein
MKTEYLACHDYASGGVWLYLMADSAAQIRERFPELRVVTDRPSWLTNGEDRPGDPLIPEASRCERPARWWRPGTLR